jgi:O-antigen/teichoic acid export membrane protein
VQLQLGLVAIFAARLAANAIRLLFVWWMSRRRFATGHVVWAVIPGLLVTLGSLPGAWKALRQTGRSQARAFVDAQGQRLVARWDEVRLAGHLLVESLPVGISLILRNYIWRVGVVLTVLWLGQQQGDLVNGLLYGPLRVVQQLRIIPAAFSASMLPVLSNRARGRMDEFDTAFAKSIKLFLAISLLITLAFNFLAEPFVVLLLGGGIDLVGAAEVLAVLGWVIVIYFLNWLYGVALVALGRQRLETLGLALGLLAGLPVARWAIPRYEALGVAYARLVS